MAGCNIATFLRENFGFQETGSSFEGQPIYQKGAIKLTYSSKDIIHVENLDQIFNPHAYVFLSRHRSEKEIPCLTAHFPGNLTMDISHGGTPKKPGITYPSLMKNYMRSLWERKQESPQYQVVLEPMHHGPTNLRRPVLFVEIGSSENQWNDFSAASIVGTSLWHALANQAEYKKVGIGFGGTHYSAKFTNFLVESDCALGAIAPKHSLAELDHDLIDDMVSRCIEPIKYAVLDWKGLGKDKKKILDLLKERGLEILRA